MPLAHSGKQTVKASEHFPDRLKCSCALRLINQPRNLRSLDCGVLAIGLNMDREVFISIWI